MFTGATTIIPACATGPEISVTERAFNEQARQWKEYNHLFDADKKQLQDPMDEMYLKCITNCNISLANVTIRDILEYLLINYGNITHMTWMTMTRK